MSRENRRAGSYFTRGTTPGALPPGERILDSRAETMLCLRQELEFLRGGINFPKHLFPTKDSTPFYEVNMESNVGNVRTQIVDHLVPENMAGHVAFFGIQSAGLVGITDEQVEYFFEADNNGIRPFDHFRGIVSSIENPIRWLIVQEVYGAQTLHIDARVLSTAEGGLDGATINITAVIAGWVFQAQRG